MVHPAPPEWRSQLLREHRLIGTIWSARESRSLSVDELSAAIGRGRYLLLGEVHDNPDHHALQAWAIAAFGKAKFVGATGGRLALEMLTEDQSEAVDRLVEDTTPRENELLLGWSFTPEEFSDRVGWEKSGWPPFKIYAPVIIAALDKLMPFVPASPSRARTRAVSKDGLALTVGDGNMKRLGLNAPLGPLLAAALASELMNSHCGMLPKEALPRMSDVQRFRDAVMADALLAGGNETGAILIAGNGHVRRDRGAPLYLERRGVKPDAIVTVMHVEVEDGRTDPDAYVPRAPDGTPAADFLWFTPREERPDPCEAMRGRLEKPAERK